MNNNYSYRGFHQSGLSMSSNQFGQDTAYGRIDSNSQPSYYSAIDKTYPMNSTPEDQSFVCDYSLDYDGRLRDPTKYEECTQPSTRHQEAPLSGDNFAKGYLEEGQTEPLFGVDFSNHSRKQWEQFQHHFQQAFEQQLTHQIHLQLRHQQQPQHPGLFGSDAVGRSGGLGADGAAVYFGDDSVGKRKRAAVGDGARFGETHPNAPSRSSGPPRNSKFYCSTCDVSYASSLAFTSHLGSSDHKTQREKEVCRPKMTFQPSVTSEEEHQQQTTIVTPRSPSSSTAPKKEYTCHLCNVTCPGADVYAFHIKSEEHQRILKSNNENKRRNSSNVSHPQDFTSTDANKAKDQEDDKEGPIGEEYLEETRNFTGNVIGLFCNLCGVRIGNQAQRMLHLTSHQHRVLYEEKKMRDGPLFGQDLRPSNHPLVFGTAKHTEEPLFGRDIVREERAGETEDDQSVRHKHSLIYPTSEDFRAVQKVSGSCIRWLKTVMNNLVDSSNQQKPITGVVKVGQLAKGLLLRYDLSCDILVLSHDWPTRTLMRSIYRELEVLKEKNTKDDQPPEYHLVISEGEDQITLENLTQPVVKCTIRMSSHVVRNENESGGADEGTDSERLKLEDCLDQLEILDRTTWFQNKGIPLPSCVLVVRVFKDIRKDNEGLQCLTDEAVESIVAEAIGSLEGYKGPGLILKRTLELLSSTLQSLDCNAREKSPPTTVRDNDNKDGGSSEAKGDHAQKIDTSHLLSRLTLKQRKDVVKVTGNLLDKILLGRMREILGLEMTEVEKQTSAKKESEAMEGEEGRLEIVEEEGNETCDDSDIPTKKIKTDADQ